MKKNRSQKVRTATQGKLGTKVRPLRGPRREIQPRGGPKEDPQVPFSKGKKPFEGDREKISLQSPCKTKEGGGPRPKSTIQKDLIPPSRFKAS